MVHDKGAATLGEEAGSGRFVVECSTDVVTPAPASEATLRRRVRFQSMPRRRPSPAAALYISGGAFEAVCKHVGWGEDVERNQIEQGGILVGRPYVDSETGKVFSVIELAIPATNAEGSGAFLRMGRSDWAEMLRKLDEHDPDSLVVGWYHTHPRSLAVFMSGTDVATQRRLFKEPWHFAVVINPQRREWRTFSGSEARDCEGFVLFPEARSHDPPGDELPETTNGEPTASGSL